MNNIYLVGFMGTGKSAVGREVARRKKRRFIDLDELIELKEKRIIPEIFAKKGEPYFRKIERQALEKVAKEKNFVVACGGGIVIDADNVKTMKATGRMICLTATPAVIWERACNFKHRPLLNVPDPKKQIELLLKLRAPYYALVDKTIDTSKISVKEAADKITKSIIKKK
ncbi:shikimate kinase [bacterium]|nr:MAG: shikimate kinase [bacterium]